MTSNYKYRGQDQGNNSPAIQGGFDWPQNGFDAGNWNSSIGFSNNKVRVIVTISKTLRATRRAAGRPTAQGWMK